MIRVSILTALLAIFFFFGASAASKKADNTLAISEVFGDGAKITTIVLHYPEEIDSGSLSKESYVVKDREITAVYPSHKPEKKHPSKSGQYVIIELKTATELQPVRPDEKGGRIQGPVAGQTGMEFGASHGDRRQRAESNPVDTASVVQRLAIRTTSDKEIAPMDAPLTVRSERTLIADDFMQGHFWDEQTSINLSYNLFVPSHLDPQKRYPLLLFIHDASGAGKDVRNTLLQGVGATIWASPEWQKEHPCIVLAPQFAQVTVDDNYNVTPDLDVCLSLIDNLIKEYPIDTFRIYTTGQSMGCMSSYVLMLKRPDLFASAMLVAGQWNPEALAPLAGKNLWLLSCKGDFKSSEGVAQAIEVWKKNGGEITEQEWPLDTTDVARDAEVADMLRHGGNIHYTHFTGGSHNNTWRKAYYIDGVRKWLFNQRRPLPPDSIVTLLRQPTHMGIFVAANQGDAHGAAPGSLQALRKAVRKGAELALTDIQLKNGKLLLPSGELLDTALHELKSELLILAHPADKKTAQAIEQLTQKESASNSIALYGDRFGTSLNYVARISADVPTDELDRIIATRPLAIELDFKPNTDKLRLAHMAERINAENRLCFNTTSPDYCGLLPNSSAHSKEANNTWNELAQMGGTIFISGQIKPLLNWRPTKP